MIAAAGREDTRQLLSRLAFVERDLGLAPRSSSEDARLLALGPWLVDEKLVMEFLMRPRRVSPVLAPVPLVEAGRLRMLRGLAAASRVRSACRARVIFTKGYTAGRGERQLRAFYFAPRRLTVKLVPPARRAALIRDLEARSRVPESLGAPAVLDHRVWGVQPYVCDELLAGHHPEPADGDLVARFVLGALWGSYLDAGIEWRRCAGSYDIGLLIRNFEDLTARVRWRAEWPERELVRRSLRALQFEEERLVPWCRAHGDLSPGSMLVCEGRICLIDWERSRSLPLLHELARSLIAYPDLWPPIRERVAALGVDAPSPGMVEPAAQARLGLLQRLVQLAARFSEPPPSAREAKREKARFERRLALAVEQLGRVLELR